jgi:hypothetical protein
VRRGGSPVTAIRIYQSVRRVGGALFENIVKWDFRSFNSENKLTTTVQTDSTLKNYVFNPQTLCDMHNVKGQILIPVMEINFFYVAKKNALRNVCV